MRRLSTRQVNGIRTTNHGQHPQSAPKVPNRQYNLNDTDALYGLRQVCNADIRKSPAALPRGLPETLEQRLLWIVEEDNAENAENIFRWIATAKRPLSPVELREAITFQATDEVFQHLVPHYD